MTQGDGPLAVAKPGGLGDSAAEIPFQPMECEGHRAVSRGAKARQWTCIGEHKTGHGTLEQRTPRHEGLQNGRKGLVLTYSR
jgi:hypothetical protein